MQAWDKFLISQEDDLGAETVRKWLRTLRVKDFDSANLYLEARDSFQVLWFEEHMRAKVTTGLLNNNKRPVNVHLSVAGVASKKSEKGATGSRKQPQAPSDSKPPFTPVFENLDPLCTFDNLVVSESNLLAHKILCEVAGLPLDQHTSSHPDSQLAVFNPIYVYGPSGTGKTHLLMATAHTLRQRGLDIIYTRAETFTEHVVQAIRSGEMAAFRRAYRSKDVLLLDDVHVFSRKNSTQEELFHTFNTLHLAGKQIILSANCAPQDLQLVEPRLVSRFEWGIVMPLEPIKAEELLLVLRKKCVAIQFPVSHKVEEFLCKAFSSSPKALCAALEALALRAHLSESADGRRAQLSTNLSVITVRDLLLDLMEDEERQLLKPEKIVQAVAESFGIRLEDIFGKSQSREFVTPRQLAMYLCRQTLKMSFTKIGDYFKRDHSTVMSGIRRVRNELNLPDSDLAVDLNIIQKKLIH